MPVKDQIEAELSQLYADTGIDLSVLPPICTSKELAPVLRITEASLGQDRHRRRGIRFVRYGGRIRYLRSDVARYLAANRSDIGGDEA